MKNLLFNSYVVASFGLCVCLAANAISEESSPKGKEGGESNPPATKTTKISKELQKKAWELFEKSLNEINSSSQKDETIKKIVKIAGEITGASFKLEPVSKVLNT